MALNFYQEKDKNSFKNQIKKIDEAIKNKQTKRIIGIASGKGGVGKTLVTINLGLAINKFGENITLVDADITASNLGLQLGTFSFPTNLQEVLNGKSKIRKAIYSTSTGFNLIPSSIALGSINAKTNNLKKVLKKLNGLILIDCPPGLDKDSVNVLNSCDDLIVVATPDLPAMTNAAKTIQIAKKMKKEILGVVVNRYNHDKYELSSNEIELMCGAPILSKIPEESDIRKSLFVRAPVLDYNNYSKATIEFYKLAAKLIKQDYNPPDFLSLKRFLQKFKK